MPGYANKQKATASNAINIFVVLSHNLISFFRVSQAPVKREDLKK
jgi:hypothetical protein